MGTNMQDIQFLSTLSLRRATIPFVQFLLHTPISIHALLAESDFIFKCSSILLLISIHALLAESDDVACGDRHKLRHFYPRSPCGERLQQAITAEQTARISIHALLAESDSKYARSLVIDWAFLSTLSLRRATIGAITYVVMTPDFYPRSPCGERPVRLYRWPEPVRFLSTLSLRRATDLLRGCCCDGGNFYPRSPCGERLDVNNPVAASTSISIHALLAESDSKSAQNSGALLRI